MRIWDEMIHCYVDVQPKMEPVYDEIARRWVALSSQGVEVLADTELQCEQDLLLRERYHLMEQWHFE